MDLLRSFISLFNRSGERSTNLNTVNLSIPVCYYGHTYVAQPNSDELKRAAFILESRNKNCAKHFSHLLSCYDEGTIILRDNSRNAVLKLEIRKVVVSGVDPKHQRLLAIVYDNDSSDSGMGMECHIFLCRTKMAAKMSANKIGDKLSKLQYKSSTQLPPRVNIDELNILARPSVSEFDYENINKFFREEVFNLSVPEPSSESSSTYLTTGCDSGRASSVDMKSDETSRDFINPIDESEEFEPEVNLDNSYKVNPRVQQLLFESHVTSHENNKTNKQIRKQQKEVVGATSTDTIKCSPLITDNTPDDEIESDSVKRRNRYNSEQRELTKTRARTIADASSLFPDEAHDSLTNNTDRYSHQYEITCARGERGYDITRAWYEQDRYENDYTSARDVSNSKYRNNIKSKSDLKDARSSAHRVAAHAQYIRNRYSVPYDEQDELSDDADDVFETRKKEDVTGTTTLHNCGKLPNDGVTLRKIDKRDLHRLTYLSATDI